MSIISCADSNRLTGYVGPRPLDAVHRRARGIQVVDERLWQRLVVYHHALRVVVYPRHILPSHALVFRTEEVLEITKVLATARGGGDKPYLDVHTDMLLVTGAELHAVPIYKRDIGFLGDEAM